MDGEIKAIIDGAAQRCTEILQQHRDRLDAVAEYLLAHETMEADVFERVFSGEIVE